MDNPLTVSLLVTLIGMAVVFLAMALIYGSMQLLAAVAKDQKEEQGVLIPPAPVDESGGQAVPSLSCLRAAAVAVALARARGAGIQGATSSESDSETTPWGEFYRRRHLGSRGRGRMG
jgi:Na+-transporting methylmalonyl-CoA/oxaloacetate decarboxylase gamma subunit